MYKTCSVYSMPGVLWIKNRDFLIVIFLIFLSYSWWFLSFKFFGDSSSFTQFFCVQHLNYNHFCEKNGEKKEKERNQTPSDLALWWWFQLIDAFFVILFFQCFDLVLMKININRQILFLHLNVRFIEKKEKNNMIFFSFERRFKSTKSMWSPINEHNSFRRVNTKDAIRYRKPQF